MRRATRGEGRGAKDRAQGAIAALAFALLFQATPAPAELIDRVVAAVNTDVITLRDLRQAMALNEAVSGAQQDQQRLLSETLEGLINRSLLVQEANRLMIAEASEQDVDAELASFENRFASDQAYRDFLLTVDMTPEDLRRVLGERLLAERFLNKRVGLFVRVRRDEAEQYFKQHPGEFMGKTFPEASRQITALLLERRTDQQITQYLSELRSRASIRINTSGE